MQSEKDLKDRKDELELLVEKVKEGDQQAFASVYDILIDPIYRYVFFRVKDEDAEDIVETVFLKVWENIRKYKAGKKSFSAWVFRIAHNLIVDYYRANSDKETQELDETLPDENRQHNPIKVTENALRSKHLKVALDKLKVQYREIIIYKFVNEFSNSEVAEILGKSEGSLRILQFRALKALKKELEEMGIKYQF